MALSVLSGTYTIFNAAFDTVIDLTGSNPAENTSIIGYALNIPPTGNQQWKLTNLQNTTIYTMQSVNPKSFIRVKGENLVPGNSLIGSQRNTPVSIENAGNGRFTIKVPNVDLAFALATGEDRTLVELQEADGTMNQFWYLRPV